jgi:hypothetical protein
MVVRFRTSIAVLVAYVDGNQEANKHKHGSANHLGKGCLDTNALVLKLTEALPDFFHCD